MNEAIEIEYIPWEKIKELGFFRSLWHTTILILFKPVEFFGYLAGKNSYLQAFYFYCVVGIPIIIVFGLFRIKGYLITLGPLRILEVFIAAIILWLVVINFLAVFAHLSARIFGGRGSFKGTFSVLAYSIATIIFLVIPILGRILSLGYSSAVIVIGFRQIHKISIIKAAVAYLFSLVLAYLAAVFILTFFKT